jgi:hypothetical protein
MDGKTTFTALRNEREEDLAFFERYLTEQYGSSPVGLASPGPAASIPELPVAIMWVRLQLQHRDERAAASEAKLREVITAGGFAMVRRAAETAFNMILEARPY